LSFANQISSRCDISKATKANRSIAAKQQPQ
jgi:hypothetical protein